MSCLRFELHYAHRHTRTHTRCWHTNTHTRTRNGFSGTHASYVSSSSTRFVEIESRETHTRQPPPNTIVNN